MLVLAAHGQGAFVHFETIQSVTADYLQLGGTNLHSAMQVLHPSSNWTSHHNLSLLNLDVECDLGD